MQLPQQFIDYTRQMMGDDRFGRLLQGLNEAPPTTIRINPLKCYHLPKDIDSRVPWCNTGYYLTTRPAFTFDPLLHAGHYYVQEASSMFIHHVLRQLVHTPVVMLDLCAAPGGKSTAARTVLPHGSLLIANEPIRRRAQVLSENIQKFGHRDVIVTNNYAPDFQRSGLAFDVILADVPCSGEGMFRRDEASVGEWSPQNVSHCWQLQRQIVSDIWPTLKPGGLLIYSTCTFNTLENEENVRWCCQQLGADIVEVETQPEWNITGSLSSSPSTASCPASAAAKVSSWPYSASTAPQPPPPKFRILNCPLGPKGRLFRRSQEFSILNCQLSIVNSQSPKLPPPPWPFWHPSTATATP